jgi:hypothetical protein
LTSKPNTEVLRVETKSRHDAYWEEHLGCIRFGGPYLSDDGKTRLGQVLVIDVDDRATAERIVTSDAFVEVGCFESWSIHRYRLSVEAGRLT